MDKIDELLKELMKEDSQEEEKEENNVSLKKEDYLSTNVEFNNKIVPIEDDDAITAMILKSALEDKMKADDLYSFFELNVSTKSDNSTAAKEQMGKAVEMRILSTSNLVKILDIRSRAKQNKNNNNLFSINVSPQKSGINIKNITDNLDDL
jgi:glucan-binding YG repeat protein